MSNIFANLGGESSSDDENTVVSDPQGGNEEAPVVVKTTKSKRIEKKITSDNANLAFLAPSYEIATKEEPRQASLKFRCQKFIKNSCSAGSICLFYQTPYQPDANQKALHSNALNPPIHLHMME